MFVVTIPGINDWVQDLERIDSSEITDMHPPKAISGTKRNVDEIIIHLW